MAINGHALRLARGERSLEEIARHTGVSRGLISRLERGERVSCRTSTLVRLARHYGLAVDELLEKPHEQ